MIQDLFKRFPDVIFIGLSATPTDNKNNLLNGFDAIINDYQTSDLIDLGWLVPFKIFSPIKINTSSIAVSKTTGDYIEKQVIEQIIKDDINKSIVDNYIKLGDDRKFICFGINKNHCSELHGEFFSKGILTDVITSNTSKKQRELIYKRFADGETKGLISIEILTAGFDDPTVKCVILASPTKQWKKYIQCCGRGIRLLGRDIKESISNGKSDCILLDCCGCVEEHGLPTDKVVLKFGKKISRVVDKILSLNESSEKRNNINEYLTEEKQVYLKKIGSLLDIYEGKIYSKESDLQEDVNNFLKKTWYFWWRQNSGKLFKDGRWIHFASKNGLPDNSVFYKNTSLFFGLELKLKHGKLTKHQKETLPEMTENKVLFFIIESVLDVFLAIEHIESNIVMSEDGIFIKNNIYNLPKKQIEYRQKLKLNSYC